jgi:hypothetical protein
MVPMLLLKASALLESMLGGWGIAPHPAGDHPSGAITPAWAVNAVVNANDATTKMSDLIVNFPLHIFSPF